MKSKNKVVMTMEEVTGWIERDYKKQIDNVNGNLLITAGAGDIDKLVDRIRVLLN